MDIESLHLKLSESGIHKFIPNSFKKHVSESSVIDMTGGTVERGGVYMSHVKIFTREAHPIKANKIAKEIRDYLYENIKGSFINDKNILNIETTTPEPLYIGEEDGMYMVSYNYEFLIG